MGTDIGSIIDGWIDIINGVITSWIMEWTAWDQLGGCAYILVRISKCLEGLSKLLYPKNAVADCSGA